MVYRHGLVKGIFLLAGIWLASLASWAILPNYGIQYQGRVEVNGQPFDGTGQFKFVIVDGTGFVMWNHEGSFLDPPNTYLELSVEGGFFEVILGYDLMMWALEPTMFYYESYLRIWFNDGVHGWQQLSPDQLFTATPYAFMADDADTVGGYPYSASWNDDQPDNDGEVPDNISINNGGLYSPVGGVVGVGTTSPFYTLDVNGDLRVTGALRDVNGFEGTPGYVLQSTGPGFAWTDPENLDSETRTAISSAPVTINSAGSYYLTQNLQTTPDVNAITVSADHVTLDLNGFAIIGPGSGYGSGVSVSGNYVTVKNGSITAFQTGVNIQGGIGASVEHVRCTSNSFAGFYVSPGSGMFTQCVGSGNGTGISISMIMEPFLIARIEKCQFQSNTLVGIFVASHAQAIILNNTVSYNQQEGILAEGNSLIKENLIIKNNQAGGHLNLDASIDSLVIDNLVSP